MGLRGGCRQPGDSGCVGLAPEEGDGPLNVVPGGPHPAQLLAVLHQVPHVAVGGHAHGKAVLHVLRVHPHHIQRRPAPLDIPVTKPLLVPQHCSSDT